MPEPKPKFFNRGIVFGSVLKKPVQKHTDGGKAYASIQLQCPNDLHGDVRVWGKIWGEAAGNALEDLSPGDRIRLEGVIQQFEAKGRVLTNFSFFNFRFCTKKEAEALRAVFILVGDLAGVEAIESGRLKLRVEHKQSEESRYAAEEYVFEAEPTGNEGHPALNSRIKVKGILEAEADYFGDEAMQRAVVKEMHVLWLADEGAPF